MKWIIGLLCFALMLSACAEKKAPTQTFTAYNLVEFQLPEGWQTDRGQLSTEVSGGFGFASPDYAGVSYLRLHKGAVFAVLGDWEETANAATALEVTFAKEISPPQSLQVLGLEATYAYGKLSQGQGIGAVHLQTETRQLIFLATVANYWENYEDIFLEIVKSLKFTDLE